MIINIRGTSGSGKSTVVRKAMELLPWKMPVKVPGRRQPLGYWLGPNMEEWTLGVPGHYETACGGCDTLKGYEQVFDLVRHAAHSAAHVLFEGVLVSEEVRRTVELLDLTEARTGLIGGGPAQPLLVIQLTTPEDVCLASIQARRDARGDTRPLNPANTVGRIKTIQRSCDKLREAGVQVEEHDRDSALLRVKEIICG